MQPPTKPISAAQREAQKTQAERAEDVAYTVNHSLACLSTDFVTNPLLGALTQKMLGRRMTATGWEFKAFGKKFTFGTCGADHAEHAHGPACDHGHAPAQGDFARITNTLLGHTVLGEVIGDTVGIPVTIAVQRFAPGFTDMLRRAMEPALGPLFRHGAKRSAAAWARENGADADAEKEQALYMYEREVRHLPQALLWTVSSLTINTLTQKLTGNKNPLWMIAVSCAAGVTATAALVVGARATAPASAEKWDRFNSEHFVLPATKTFDKLTGNRWTERTSAGTPAASAAKA